MENKNEWHEKRILEWLEQALVGAAIVRKNLMVTGVPMTLKEPTL
jgi:hypothetical protein